MSAILTGWAGSTVSGLISEWFGHVLTVRAEENKEDRVRRRAAAAELISPLRELQGLLRRYGLECVSRDEVDSACRRWAVAMEEFEEDVSLKPRYALRNVQQAVGVVFGGVAYIHTQPDAKRMELGTPDAMWQDYAEEYLGYVAKRLQRWGHSRRGEPVAIESFDRWLVKTERRDPFGTVSLSSSARPARGAGPRCVRARRVESMGQTAPAPLEATPEAGEG